MALRIGLLGPFEVVRSGQRVAVTSSRQRALLAALATAAGRSVPAAELACQVWDDDQPRQLRASLHTLVARLRQLLGTTSIHTTPNGYRLEVAPDDVDVARFLRLLDVTGDTGEAERARLRSALALWRGEPVCPGAPRLIERYLTAVERRVDLDLAAGDHAGLAAELTDLTARYPLREPLWERLIRAHTAGGRNAEALATYARCRQRLADELGVEPGEALRQLHLELLAADERPASAPAVTAPPRQLPLEIGRFTGRVRELAALNSFLAGARRGDAPIVVVDGPAGAGKTSLVVRWANQTSAEFDGGQLFLDLRGHADARPMTAAEALDTLLRALAVPADAIPATVDERSGLLRSTLSGQRMLLVLDNARDAAQVRPLLPGAGAVVVITSRNQLRGLVAREGATRVHVGEFDQRSGLSLLAAVVGRSRVDAEREASAAIVELCGRLPLAVALAAERASRFPDLTLAELASTLTDQRRLDTLRDPYDERADLSAAFSWSYQALSPAAARTFRLLSLHPGPEFGREPVAALCGITVPAAADLLDELAATHMLNQPRSGRFRFHDLIRDYAAAQAATEETEQTRRVAWRGLMDWYLRMAGRAHSRLGVVPHLSDIVDIPPDDRTLLSCVDSSAALTWFELEREALEALVHYAAAKAEHDDVWRLTWLLHGTFRRRYYVDAWLETAELGLVAAKATGVPLARFNATNNLGAAYSDRFPDKAAAVFRATLHDCRDELDDALVAQLLSNLAICCASVGDYESALAHHREALDLTPAHDALSKASHLCGLAKTYIKLGRFQQSLEAAVAASVLFRGFDESYLAALTTRFLAESYHGLGELDTAAKVATQAIDELERAGNVLALMDALIRCGHIYADAGQRAMAESAWRRALALLEQHDDKRVDEVRDLLS